MLFKNATLYRLRAPLDLEQLEEKIAASPFQPCGSQDLARIGWVSPLGGEEELVFQAGGCHLICLRKQQKILPGAAVAEAVDAKVKEIEREQARQVFRKERKQIKEEVVVSLLPKALTRSSRMYAYINPAAGLLIVGTPSRSRAEELLAKLREDLESLPIVPLTCNSPIGSVMTDWVVNGSLPQPFALGQQCDLRDVQESGNTVKVRGQDLRTDEVLQHAEAGKQVTKIELRWRDAIDCLIDDELILRRIHFDDAIHERIEALGDARAQFDQEFSVMALELGHFIDGLVQLFGGEVKS